LGGKYQIYTPWEGNKSLTQGMFQQLADDFEALGGRYMLETEVTDLIYEDGNVAGVKAVKYDGTNVTVKARKVILATGGFGGSYDLMNQYLGEDWRLYGMAQNEGTGIALAVDAGAATYNIDMPPMSHFAAPEVITNCFEDAFDNDIPYALVSTSETLAVNKSGERFLNEEMMQYSAYIGGSRFYTIYSSDQIDILREQGFAKDASGRYLNHFGVGGVPTADVPMSNIDAALNAAYSGGAAGSDGKKYIVSAIKSGGEREFLVYEPETGQWYKEDDLAANAIVNVGNAVYAQTDSANLIVSGAADPDEGRFEASATFADFDLQTFGSKYPVRLWLRMESEQTVTVKVIYNGGAAETAVRLPSGDKHATYFPVPIRRCDRFGLQISSMGAWKLYAMEIEVRAETTNRKRG
jgi:hypothetical protein